MASLPNPKTVTYEEWLEMPVVDEGIAVFDRTAIIEENGYYHSAPQLAIEVLWPSETRRMTERELRDYGDISTSEVWVVSPEASTVEVLRLEDGHLRHAAILAEGILKPREFPNVQVDISSIWPH